MNTHFSLLLKAHHVVYLIGFSASNVMDFSVHAYWMSLQKGSTTNIPSLFDLIVHTKITIDVLEKYSSNKCHCWSNNVDICCGAQQMSTHIDHSCGFFKKEKTHLALWGQRGYGLFLKPKKIISFTLLLLSVALLPLWDTNFNLGMCED